MSGRGVSRRALIILAGGLLLSACSAAAAQEGTGAPDTPGAGTGREPVSWQSARLAEPDSQRLIVHLYGGGPPDAPVGPCNPHYAGTAELDGGVLTVTVHAERPPSDEPVVCTMIAYKRTVTVELPAAFEGDTAVDGATGETRSLS